MTPRGFYLNRGVFYFGRMIENEMGKAEARARKNRTGSSADALANGARLGVLERYLGVPIKRYRDPGNLKSSAGGNKEETIVVKRESDARL